MKTADQTSVHIKNASAIITVDDEDRVLYNADILVRDGVLTGIDEPSILNRSNDCVKSLLKKAGMR
jgi:hypothetical protein